jgi:peptide/nickel transport system substrate-binding protein
VERGIRGRLRSGWSSAVVTAAAMTLSGCAHPQGGAPDIGRLVVVVPHHLITLDPHEQDTLSTFSILGNVYEPLVEADATLRLQPGLAERWESPDPLTWVFPLRRGVRFHDGRELRAADVVHSVRRLLDDPGLDVRVYVSNVASVEELDPFTVRLRTTIPSPNLLVKLTQVYIVPAGTGTGTGLGNAANGTGPYRITEWQAGRAVRLSRFDDHWRGRPSVKDAVLERRDCASFTPAELTSGRFDIVGTACPEPLPSTPGLRVERRAGLYVKYLGMDVSRAQTPFVSGTQNPFRDLRVRQAMSLAVDRERLVRSLGLPARPAWQAVPRTVLGFNPLLESLRDGPNRARARQLLAEAGFAEGFESTLHVREPLRQGVEALREDLAAVGVRTRLEVLDEVAFANRMSRGEGSLWLTRFACTGGDASDLFEAFFSGERRFSVHGGYANPEMKQAFAAIAKSEHNRERRDRLQDLVTQLSRDLPIVPLYNDEDVYLIREGIAWEPRNDALLRIAEVTPAPR